MNLLRSLPILLILWGCSDSPKTETEKIRTVYQSGDLVITEMNLAENRLISITRSGKKIALLMQDLKEGEYHTSSLSPWYEKSFYGVYSDENKDGHMESLLIKDPLDENHFRLYDIPENGKPSLASPQKHQQLAETFGLMTEFWEEKVPKMKTAEDLEKEGSILKEKIKAANQAVEPTR